MNGWITHSLYFVASLFVGYNLFSSETPFRFSELLSEANRSKTPRDKFPNGTIFWFLLVRVSVGLGELRLYAAR